MPYKYRDHAWLASFGEKDGRRYVVVVLVEHGGHGGEVAGPWPRAVFDYLFGPPPGKPVQPEPTLRQLEAGISPARKRRHVPH
jgi:penicillin-binding protein 2